MFLQEVGLGTACVHSGDEFLQEVALFFAPLIEFAIFLNIKYQRNSNE